MNKNFIYPYLILFCNIILLNSCSLAPTSPSGLASVDDKHQDPRLRVVPIQQRHYKQIALLLPLQGAHEKEAQAIQAGFFASFYADPQESKPLLKVYNTTGPGVLEQNYQQALQDGADFIVGPLLKEDVIKVSNLARAHPQVPVLALNYLSSLPAQGAFFQYALTPEQESGQLVAKAWAYNYRCAAILVPDNAWGKRMAKSLEAAWQARGGQIVDISYANPERDQAKTVRQLLAIDEKTSQALKKSMASEVNRRQDIEVIFMAAPAEQARQLKPMLNFYFADNIPVFATSSIYTGIRDSHKDNDLNGIIFADMPILLNAPTESQRFLLNTSYVRLAAMGWDAYALVEKLAAMQQNPDYQYDGVSGRLHLQHQQLMRELTFAKMTRGIAEKY